MQLFVVLWLVELDPDAVAAAVVIAAVNTTRNLFDCPENVGVAASFGVQHKALADLGEPCEVDQAFEVVVPDNLLLLEGGGLDDEHDVGIFLVIADVGGVVRKHDPFIDPVGYIGADHDDDPDDEEGDEDGAVVAGCWVESSQPTQACGQENDRPKAERPDKKNDSRHSLLQS